MAIPLAGHTNSYHTYGVDEALAGIAQAGFRGVELSAVPGWTEHVSLDGTEDIRRKLEVLEGIYEVISSQASHFRTEFLEVVVVILILIEVLLAVFSKH